MSERVVVAHQAERIVRPHFDTLVGNGILRLQAELIHGAGCMYLIFAPAFVDLFRDHEDREENDGEDNAADRGHFFSNEIDPGDCEEQRRDDAYTDRNLIAIEFDVERHFPFAFGLVFETEHQHRQTFEGK